MIKKPHYSLSIPVLITVIIIDFLLIEENDEISGRETRHVRFCPGDMSSMKCDWGRNQINWKYSQNIQHNIQTFLQKFHKSVLHLSTEKFSF